MKKKYILLYLLFPFLSFGQNIEFADENFKELLVGINTSDFLDYSAKNSNGNYIAIDADADGEISLSEAQAVYHLDIYYAYMLPAPAIADFSGLENFTNLRTIDCGGHTATMLDLTACQNLELLHCEDGDLINLHINGLAELETVYCDTNALTGINLQGLSALKFLDCHNNNLASLDVTGLSAIEEIIMYQNDITAMNFSGLTTLAFVDCSSNAIASVNLEELSNLTKFIAYYNQLETISLAGLQSLEHIELAYNQLTTVSIAGLGNLTFLDCTDNPVNYLDFSQPNALKEIYCHGCNLTTLDVSGSSELLLINVMDNALEYMDLSANPVATEIYLSNNQMVYLNLKNNNVLNTYVDIDGNPDLQAICADEAELWDLQSLIEILEYDCIVTTDCPSGPMLYSATGSARFDNEGSGCGEDDIAMPMQAFSINTGLTTQTYFSNTFGEYSIPLAAGTYTLTAVNLSGYYTVSPETAEITVGEGQEEALQDFCYTSTMAVDDLELTFIPTVPARPGFDASYRLICTNKGTTALSGDVVLNFMGSLMDFVSSTVPVDSSSDNVLIWSYTELNPFDEIIIDIVMNINAPTENPAVNIDDDLGFSGIISPYEGDMTSMNNSFNLKQVVVGSYDPNDKTCVEGTTITPEMAGEYVTYLIRFENTGNYYAENIVVVDRIDLEKFDISTLQPLQSSHDYVTRITEGNKVEFIFEGIMLPGEPSDDRHGYVAFKIKTLETLQLDDTFSNTAAIYFDFNAPIITNEAVTTIALLGTADFEFSNYLTLYPNPSADILNIDAKEGTSMRSVEVYNILGQMVILAPNVSPNASIDVSRLAVGTYTVKVSTDKGAAFAKFIKE